MTYNIPEDVKDGIKVFGLSDYEIYLYIAFISKEPMNASVLSKTSGII